MLGTPSRAPIRLADLGFSRICPKDHTQDLRCRPEAKASSYFPANSGQITVLLSSSEISRSQRNKMHHVKTLLLFVALSSTTGAQQLPKTATGHIGQQAAPSTQSRALPAGYRFAPAIPPNTTVGGRTFTKDTIYALMHRDSTNIAAFNDHGDIAFPARWADSGKQHGGIYTLQRVVAEDGDQVGEGMAIVELQGEIHINNVGQVSYIATYTDKKCGTCVGVFLEKQLVIPDLGSRFHYSNPPTTLTDNG